MKKLLPIIFLLLSSCFYRKAVVIKTEDGVVFKMSRTGKIQYKDKDMTAELDTRKPSVLEDIIKLWGIRMVNDRGDN